MSISTSRNSILRLENISKSFGEVKSLINVDFEIFPGEIVGLLGDNGAGKSTLIKIITGYHTPDDGGSMYWKGKLISSTSISERRKLGIEVVYQERALIDQQNVWKNIFMGRELTNRTGMLLSKKMRQETYRLMDEMGFTSTAVTPDSIVKTMSGGERQGIAISRALYFDAELIILDEPTMGLSLAETEKTIEFIQATKKTGKSVIYIDHNLFHLFPVVDRIVVLDRGRIAGQFMKDEISFNDLISQLRYVAKEGTLQ